MTVKEAIELLAMVNPEAELLGFDMDSERMQPVTGFNDSDGQVEIITAPLEEEG